MRPILTDRDVTEICINRPGEAYVETREGWRCVPLAFATFDWCQSLAKLVANSTRQRIDAESPLLSAALPGGRAHPDRAAAGDDAGNRRDHDPPARRTNSGRWRSSKQRGLFRATRRASTAPDDTETELTRRLDAKDYRGFLRFAVERRRNILVSGPTGSGKTTFTKALIREIPAGERLITIEDAKELVLDRHDNHVRLFYSKDDQGLARVTPKQLLESCLRMKPDRILLAELRGEEAFDYLRNVNSGHPGLDHEHSRRERRARVRAARAARQAEPRGPGARARGDQEPAVSPDRRRRAVRHRAPAALH